MPLSEDSRALLQLLLGRGKSYADISGLLGIDEDEVRSRAVAALAEIDPSVPAPDAEMTDYLLGQADPITRADVGNRISTGGAAAEQAEALTDQLRLLVPAAELPDPGTARGGKPKPAPAPVPKSDSGNDRDMLTGNTAGIVVGNFDPELESLKRSRSQRIYFAKAHCAGGIIEGLRHYGLIGQEAMAEASGIH